MRETVQSRQLSFDGQTLRYTLTRKRVKNINLRIRQDGSVAVSAGGTVPIMKIEDFIKSRWEYIHTHIKGFESRRNELPNSTMLLDGEEFYLFGHPLSLLVEQCATPGVEIVEERLYLRVQNPDDLPQKERQIEKFIDGLCREYFEQVARQVFDLFEGYALHYPSITIRSMKSRWGSCSPTRQKITLNKKLIKTPMPCIEYVVLHEFAHFIHPNHSRAFYELVASLMPDWQERRKKLAMYSAL